MLILEKMLVLFLLMFVGYIMVKTKVIQQEGSKVLSAIVVNVANPALVISAATGDHHTMSGKDLGFTVLLSVIIYFSLVLIAGVMPKVLGASKQDEGCYRVMTVFSNIAFMGFPLLSSIYGREALLYAAVFQMPFNILMYTYGIRAIKDEAGVSTERSWKKMINVGVVSCVITVVLYFAQIKPPAIIGDTLTYLGNLTAPLSMIVIGTSFAEMNFKEVITDRKLLLFSCIKLILIPIIGCFLLKAFVSNEMLRGVCIVIIATPVASMTAMLAQQYEGNYELASKGVALSTLLSVITMPILFAFFK